MSSRPITAPLAGPALRPQRRRVTTTAAIVVAVHFLRYAGPLIYVPLVVRLLAVDEAGAFFRWQSLGFLLALFVEFGLSGTALRDWVRQEDAAARSRLFNALMAERAGNAAAIGAVCLAAAALGQLTALDLALILPFALATGANMTWYFMASGRAVTGSIIEAASQAVGVALLVAAMAATGSAVWAVAALVAGQLVNVAWGLLAARRDGIAIRPGLRLDLGDKLAQLPMFVLRIGAMISSAGSPWVVATLGGVAQAGLYGPAARLFGAIGATMSPVGDVLIPLISRHVRSVERHRALWISGGALAGGALVAAAIHLLAGPVATFLYGGLGPEAAGIVRTLALSVPFLFAAQALSLFVLVPGGRERIAALAILCGALLFLALAFLDRTAGGAALAKLWADILTFAVMFALTMIPPRGTAHA